MSVPQNPNPTLVVVVSFVLRRCLFGWPPFGVQHIVLYLADDLGWNLVNLGGGPDRAHNPDVFTPTMSTLARAGVILDRHYTCVTTLLLHFDVTRRALSASQQVARRPLPACHTPPSVSE